MGKKSLPQPDPLDVLTSRLFQSLSPATLLDVRAQIHCWNYGNIMKHVFLHTISNCKWINDICYIFASSDKYEVQLQSLGISLRFPFLCFFLLALCFLQRELQQRLLNEKGDQPFPHEELTIRQPEVLQALQTRCGGVGVAQLLTKPELCGVSCCGPQFYLNRLQMVIHPTGDISLLKIVNRPATSVDVAGYHPKNI